MSVSVRGKASEHCKGAGVYLPFLVYLKEIFLYGAPWCKFFKKGGNNVRSYFTVCRYGSYE